MVSKFRTNKRRTNTNSQTRELIKSKSKIDFQTNHDEDSEDDYPNNTKRQRRRIKDTQMDEDVSSNDDDSEDDFNEKESDDEIEETVESKKIRLAKEYLAKISSKIGDESDSDTSKTDDSDSESESKDEENVHGSISKKLAKERLKREGTLHRDLALKTQESILQMYYSMGILPKPTPPTTTSNPNNTILNQIQQFPLTFTSTQTKQFQSSPKYKQLRGHDLTPTCVSLHKSGTVAYSGSKDNSVIAWDIEHAKKCSTIIPNWKQTDMTYSKNSGEILALANSDDGRYLAVGGRDCVVRVFDVRLLGKGGTTAANASNNTTNQPSLITTFQGHKGAVTSLAFRTHSLQLFSGSEDRCIRNYNLDQMVYTETLYGHQGPINSLSCHLLSRPISTGRDRTLRAWKINEESHLIYRGGSKATSADCVAQINDSWCLTGHENGDLNLWFMEKKKPTCLWEYARNYVNDEHGNDADVNMDQTKKEDGSGGKGPAPGSGIVCVDALRGSDLAMSGTNDGVLRLWQVKTGKSVNERGMVPIARIPVHGFVNGVAIGPKGRFCVAAIGQEHRLGRWERVPKAKNRFAIISLKEQDHEPEQEVNVEE